MLIWALFATMTAAAVLFVLAPLARGREVDGAARGEDGDLAVYKDQLGEIERDVASGLVAARDAEAARAEIARRLLRASRRAEVAPSASRRRSLAVALVAIVLVPAITIATYLTLGRPDMPDAPLAARRAVGPEGLPIEDLVTRVEKHLAEVPDDARGWEIIAPVYMRLGRAEDAAAAWGRAVKLAGATEKRQNGLGEALVVAASGTVTADARVAFQKSLELEPAGVLPRMYLALALFQEGKPKESAAAWRVLVAAAGEDAPWLPTVRQELARAEAAAAGEAAPVPAPGAAAPPNPSAADIDAAGKMEATDRAKMIESMVERLDARLKASGGSLEEWERLVRSQKMLGRLDAARATLDRARVALAADPASAARLDALAAGL